MTQRHRLIEALRLPVHGRFPVRRSTIVIALVLIALAVLYGSIEPSASSKSLSSSGITLCSADGKCSKYVQAPTAPNTSAPKTTSSTTPSVTSVPTTAVPSPSTTFPSTTSTTPNGSSTTVPGTTLPRSATTTTTLPGGATTTSSTSTSSTSSTTSVP